MKTLAVFLATIAASTLPGCARPSPPMLHRLADYAGEVRVTSVGQPEIVCDLAFSRAAGAFQVKFRRGERVVTVVRGAGQKVTVFEDAVERAADATERAWYRLVHDLCDPAQVQAVEAQDASYRVQRAGRWYGLEIESQTRVRIHGQPR